MPQNTAITIKDGATTPADHVFSPTSILANLAQWNERGSSGSLVGQPTITWSVRAPTKQSATYKVTGKLSVPKAVTVTDSTGKTVTSVDYTNLASLDVVLHERSSKQERKDLRVMMSNLLINAVIAATIDDVEGIW
jgi:phosphoribosylformylglycinamidine (FGAM) synthase PurS component